MFFSLTDHLRILYLFDTDSPHYPGRLKPETTAAMKEALWLWVRGESRIGLRHMFTRSALYADIRVSVPKP